MFRISCSFPLATSDELKICLSTVIFRFEENLYAYITQMHLVKFMWKFAAVLSTKYYLQALERRRSRLEHAAALQQIQWTEDPTTPVQAEQSIPQSTPLTQETLAVVASDPSPTLVVVNPTTSFAEDKLKAASSPSDCSLQTTLSKTNDPAHADREKELSISIEQIEKIMSRNLKKAPKAAQPSKVTVQRCTLMSMR
jgi:hypothetical protein